MLRLSKLSDYAIVMLSHLARTAHVCVHPASGIAESTGIPLPTVAKILKVLTREGLLLSTRGAHGGYALARDPRRITVIDVIEAMDGPVALTACAHTDGEACAEEAHCQLPPHWPVINGVVRGALEGVTILDLSGPIARRPAPVPTATLGGTT